MAPDSCRIRKGRSPLDMTSTCDTDLASISSLDEANSDARFWHTRKLGKIGSESRIYTHLFGACHATEKSHLFTLVTSLELVMETELLPSFHFVRPIACLSFDGRRKVLADPPEYSVRLAVPGRRQPLGFLRGTPC